MKIELSKPLSYKDSELAELDLELDSLTGRDLIDAEESLKARGVNISAWEFSRTYLLGVAAKCLHLPADVLKDLPASDFTKVINEVLSFLAGQASSGSTPEA